MSTLLQFPAAADTQSWNDRYYLTTDTLTTDGHYAEFVVTENNFGCGFGVANAITGALSAGVIVWPFSTSTVYILAGGGAAATYSRPVALFDRFRFTRSGDDVVISQNGIVFHTQPLAGTLYGYAASHSGVRSSVDIDSVSGVAPTTRATSNCTVTLGVPSTDYFANNTNLFYTPVSWVGTGKSKTSSQPVATIRFLFTGDRAGIIFDAAGQASVTSDIRTEIAYRIDGGSWSYHTIANETLAYKEIANGLAAGTHLAEVSIAFSWLGARYGTTNRYSEIVSYGVRLPTGSTLSAAPVRPRFAIGYTDSNGEGSESGVGGKSNALVSYSQIIADAINANISLQSVPGQGWITTPDQNQPPAIPTMADGWDLYPNGDSKITAGSLAPEPNVIFICHGQNDNSSIVAAATAVVNDMLAVTTSAKIVIMCPAGRSRRSELLEVVAAVNNPRVLFFDNPTDWLANYSYGPVGQPQNHVHLTAEGHAQYAAVMAPQFVALFPNPTNIRNHFARQMGAI